MRPISRGSVSTAPAVLGLATAGLVLSAALVLVPRLCTPCAPLPRRDAISRHGRERNEVLATIVAAGPRPGDVIFRRGRSVLSRAVLAADGDGSFSHVGMIVAGPRGTAVVHAIPGEDGADDGARSDPLGDFLAPDRASDAALYRLTPNDDRRSRRAADAARDFAVHAVPFDGGFDLEGQEKVYCTELVWAAFRTAGIDLVEGPMDDLGLPFAHFGRGPYLLPGRLASSTHLRLIATTRSKESPDHEDHAATTHRDPSASPPAVARLRPRPGLDRRVLLPARGPR